MLAAMQERTQYIPTVDNALMMWIVRHAAWLIPRFRGNNVQSPFYRAMGGPYRGKAGGIWRNCSCTSSRSWKGIWKSRTEAGRQMDICRVAGQERLHGRTPCSNRRRELYVLEVCDDLQNTAGQKKNFDQSSRLHRSRGRQQQTMQLIFEQYQQYANMTTRNEKPPDKPEDDDHDMQGEMLTEPDTTTTTSSGRGEKRPETQENVFTKKRVMTKSPKRPIHTCPTF